MNTTRLAPILLSLTAGCAMDESLDQSVEDTTIADAYSAIRAQEANFPLPTPTAENVVATFDGSTGAVSGELSTYSYILDPHTGKPHQMRSIPKVNINAVATTLRFNLTNRGAQAVTLTANGVTVTAPAGQTYVSIAVGTAPSVAWTLVVGAHSKSDILDITHPYYVGAGVLTVPALPISVIYEPPQYTEHKNTASYTITKSIANTLTMSFKDDNATTTDADPDVYQNVSQIDAAIGNLVTVLGSAPDVPNRGAVTSAFGAIQGALGSVSAQQTEGKSNSTESALTVTDTLGIKLTTSLHLGPGAGDRILYLTNARFVWVCDRGVLSIALLGFDSELTDNVQTFQADLASGAPIGPATHLPADSIRALLALDPFVAGGPNVALDPNRFVNIPPYTVGGTGGEPDTYTLTHQIVNSDQSATSQYATLITDERAGWLAFAGIGVTDTAKITVSTTQTASATLTTTDTASTSLDLYETVDRPRVGVYYDRVFGAFAFKAVP